MTPPLPGTGSTQSSSPSVRSPPAPSGCCFQTRSVSRNNIASPPAFSYTETPDLGCKPSIICSRRLQATLTSFMLMCAISTCYTPQRQAYPAAYIAPVLIMAHHLVADRITAIHGTGNTSVRADGEKIKENSTFKYLAWFYSQFQINSVILPMRQLLCCSLFFFGSFLFLWFLWFLWFFTLYLMHALLMTSSCWLIQRSLPVHAHRIARREQCSCS